MGNRRKGRILACGLMLILGCDDGENGGSDPIQISPTDATSMVDADLDPMDAEPPIDAEVPPEDVEVPDAAPVPDAVVDAMPEPEPEPGTFCAPCDEETPCA